MLLKVFPHRLNGWLIEGQNRAESWRRRLSATGLPAWSLVRPVPPRMADALRTAQLDLLRRSRPILLSTSLLTFLMLAVGLWNPGTSLVLLAGLLVFPTAHFALWRLDVVRPGETGPGQTLVRAFVIGLIWLCLGALLLAKLDVAQRVALAVAFFGLLAACVLAAAVIRVALAAAIPIALFAAIVVLSLHLSRRLELTLFAYVPIMLAIIVSTHRVLSKQLLHGLLQQDRREQSDQLLRELEETANNWLWASNAQGRLTRLSPSVADRLGIAPDGLSDVLLASLLDTQRDTEGAAPRIIAAFGSQHAFRDIVVPITIAGHARWLSVSGRPVTTADGEFAGYQGLAIDVTQARENEARIAFLALNDSLTGLPNRASFDRRLDGYCRAGWKLALVCISLGDFQAINNTLGADAGDMLLVAFAQRLRQAVRASDYVARLGGGEFGVLIEGLDRDGVAELASRVAAETGAPYRLTEFDADVASGVSVGVSLAPEDATDAISLQRNASLALASARRDGIERPRFFAAPMLAELQERRAIESDLRQALERGELTVCYHPIVDLFTGAVISAEALLRWQHPTRGFVPPSTFIPLAESAGIIVPIGRFAMAEACRQAVRWSEKIRVAVNVSAAQFKDEALLQSIDAALAASGLPSTRLDLEITESVLLEASRSTLQLLRGVRDRGIRVALDDFGTGYSSLRYLRSFAFDKVKIDASFVRDMATDAEAAAIVRATIGLARSFGLKTTAEGIETEAQREGLCAFGCTEGQGYLFSRVRDADSMAAFVGPPTVEA